MITSTKFIEIAQASVAERENGSFDSLFGPVCDPSNEIESYGLSNWFELPPYRDALTFYISFFPEEDEVRNEPMTITYCYKWILEGLKREISTALLTQSNRHEYLVFLRRIFEDMLPATQKYTDTIDKLNSLPEGVAMQYSTLIDIYRRAAKGAINVINSGIEFIDSRASKKEVKESSQQIDQRENVFNTLTIDEARRWFIQLAENNSRNGKPFLTKEQVEQFIERAFVGNTAISAPLLNATNREKSNIIGLFHLFFDHCNTHRTKMGKIDPIATADRYIRLLVDNVNRWTFDQVKHNFRRGGNWKIPT